MDIDNLKLEQIKRRLQLEDLEGRYRGNQLGAVQSPYEEIRNKQTQDRIKHTLATGKPLVN